MKKFSIALVVVVVLALGYYAISPIFKNTIVHDAVPVMEDASMTTLPTLENPTFPVMGTEGHPASGIVQLIDTAEGAVVRYEDYKTINGPDLFVYLSKDLEAKEFINLGELKGTEGEINYSIPNDVDLKEYKYVLTWCKQFGVLFNYAELVQPNVQDEMEKDAPRESPMDTATNTTEPTAITPAVTTPTAQKSSEKIERTALLANGCFWCVEHDLEKVSGVTDVVSGYAGGSTENPTYKNYITGGHREVVLVTYDASKITFANLVEHIIKHGDPTDAHGSFGDRGPQYAPAIYYENNTEKSEAYRVIKAIDDMHVFEKPLPLAVISRVKFWPAEDYHQNYGDTNPIRYTYYRTASGRDNFIKKYWGDSVNTFVVPDMKSFDLNTQSEPTNSKEGSWAHFVKPSSDTLKAQLTSLQYNVTQENGTEPPYTNAYDKNYDEGIYVDIVSGEPLYLSRDKFDSGTGWPSFVKPISNEVVVLHEDNTLFSKRTEVRSRYADSHIGHVFDDGPKDRGGKRYCMNSAAMRFIPRSAMEQEGYAYLFPLMDAS